MPPSTARRESFDARYETHEEIDPLWTEEPINHTSRTSKKAPNAEGEEDDPIDVDAHQTGNFLVFRNSAHGFADPRPLHQPIEAEHQKQSRAEHKNLHHRDVDITDFDHAL